MVEKSCHWSFGEDVVKRSLVIGYWKSGGIGEMGKWVVGSETVDKEGGRVEGEKVGVQK
jgi:hypothetical protein